jgi:hypothetical protein
MFQVDGYAVPDPPWLVCKGPESRCFELHEAGGQEFEMRILGGDRNVIASRRFETSQAAIEWGFAERRLLEFDGWKHPYDAEVDDAFEDGVRNWNMVVLGGQRASRFRAWEMAMTVPEARRACVQYAGAPYLGLLTPEELFARYRLLCMSLMEVTRDGRLEVSAWDEWHDRWVHTAAEILLRDLPLDDDRGCPDWSFLQSERLPRATAAYARRKLDWGERILVKYGSTSFLRPALEEGLFRISPASYYNDPSLDTARRDAELERYLVDTATVLTSTLRRHAEGLGDDEKALYTRVVQSATDYYIFCVAGEWELRLFEDFSAGACLVITDPARFARALGDAAQSQLPDWNFACAYVRYIDPVQDLQRMNRGAEERFAPFFCKDFRYSYQKEVRAAWLPPDPGVPAANLEHLFVRLGNLEDYCELIEL